MKPVLLDGAAVKSQHKSLEWSCFNCNADFWGGAAKNLANMFDQKTEWQVNVHFRNTKVLTIDKLITNDTRTTANIKHDWQNCVVRGDRISNKTTEEHIIQLPIYI